MTAIQTPSTIPICNSQTATGEYHIRRLTAEDAEGVVDCVRKIYGDSYIIHTELYHPEQIVQLNQIGSLVSVVALAPDSQIVGHYALERPDHSSTIAESGEAMVMAEHRHHFLLEKMRVLLEQEAARLGLRGIFGRTVTNHLFSQKVVERFGERPCGMSLGRTPQTFHNMELALPQRMSIVFYFKYLGSAETVPLYLPAHHQDMIGRIYAQFALRPDLAELETATGTGHVTLDHHPELKRANILVHRIGADTRAAVSQLREELGQGREIEVIYLELPLSDPGAHEVCQAAEEEGFFFSGVAPLYLSGRDTLRLQFLAVDLDTSILQIENPFARELLVYVNEERRRIAE